MVAQLLRKGAVFFSVGLGLLGIGHQADAVIVSYTDRPTFLANVVSPVNIDFNGIPNTDNVITYSNSTGLTVSTTAGNVLFVGVPDNAVSYRLTVLDPVFEGNEYNGGSGDVLSGPGGNEIVAPGKIVATLPGFVYAVGADMFPYDGAITDLTATLSTGENIVITGAGDSHLTSPHTEYFAGFISDSPISSISFKVATAGPTLINIDNFVFEQLPEPASGTMLLGLAGAVIARRRRR